MCRALMRGLRSALPWWVRVRVRGRADGYHVRSFSLRPPHIPAQSSRVTLRSGEPLDPARVVREILETVQHYMGHEYVRAWPGDQVLPSLDRDPAETHDEAHIPALTAWFGAFPKPNAQVEGDTIRVWFGDESAPTLTLPSLSNALGLPGADSRHGSVGW